MAELYQSLGKTPVVPQTCPSPLSSLSLTGFVLLSPFFLQRTWTTSDSRPTGQPWSSGVCRRLSAVSWHWTRHKVTGVHHSDWSYLQDVEHTIRGVQALLKCVLLHFALYFLSLSSSRFSFQFTQFVVSPLHFLLPSLQSLSLIWHDLCVFPWLPLVSNCRECEPPTSWLVWYVLRCIAGCSQFHSISSHLFIYFFALSSRSFSYHCLKKA